MRTTEVVYDEIAARHGLTEGAVKAAAHRLFLFSRGEREAHP